MRPVAFLLLALLAPTALAGPALPVYYDVDVVTTGGLGVSVVAGTTSPPQCADCTEYAVGAAVLRDASGLHVDAFVCRSGFFHVCVVDEHLTLP